MVRSIIGYADRISARPGETIRFMVSCTKEAVYRAQLVRVVCGDCNPKGPGLKLPAVDSSINGTYEGRNQPINAGSYVFVPAAAPFGCLSGFTVQAMIWPTTPHLGEQVLLSCWSAGRSAGFELIIDADGAVALRVGDGTGRIETISTDQPLSERAWYFVCARLDSATKRVTVHQRRQVAYAGLETEATAERTIGFVPAADEVPLLMAARLAGNDVRGRRRTEAHFNGRIDSPRLSGRALPLDEALALHLRPLPERLLADLVGAWDFSLEIPTLHVVDISSNSLHGETVNLPARAMTGYNWSGAEMNWRAASHEYGAIHFHDDDIYDAGWDSDFALLVPESLRSGSYAVRVNTNEDEDYVPFFVRRPTGKPSGKILYLAQTATYLAYANHAFNFAAQANEMLSNHLVILDRWEQHLNLHSELGNSLYDLHSDGSGICYSSRLRPVLNMRPMVMSSTAGLGSMLWGYNADTHLTDWLEAKGFTFDVATDEDLHAEGTTLLRSYDVVLTGTHPEYYSAAMRQALIDYTARGGRLMYMGGNGFYWRIAYHPTLPGVIEVRRAEDGTRAWVARPGEYYHSFTGEYGGLWLRQNRPPQQLVGTGFIAQGFDHSVGYRRTPESADPRVAFAFEGIGMEETIGNFGLIGGGAAGLEVDIVDPTLGTPPHALVVARSEALTDTYLLVNEEMPINTPDMMGTMNPRIRSDIVFFETGNGGAVFAFSSMAWCGSLAHNCYDNNVSRLTENVLRRFAAAEPL
jgi:N,N-dimethylformamidase